MKSYATMLSMVLFSNSVFASVVYDNGSFGSSANDISVQMVADDFKLSTDTLLTGVSFYAFGDNGRYTPWDGTIDYAIFRDGGNSPGKLLVSGKGQSVSRDVAFDWGYPYGEQFRFNLTFQDPVLASKDTIYWMGIHLGSTYNYSRWYWNFTPAESGGNSSSSFGGNLSNWTNWFNRDRAFYLSGSPASSVPEPSMWALLTGAFLVLGFWRRRNVVQTS